MKYYKVKVSSNPDITGAEPQLLVKNPTTYSVPNGLQQLPRYALETPPFDPVVFQFYINTEDGARLTDFIGYNSPVGFLISEKAYEIFKKHKVHPHLLYKTDVFCEEHIYTYFYVHFYTNFIDYLDFIKSRFCVFSLPYRFERDIQIQSYKDYENAKGTLEMLEIIELVTPVFGSKSICNYHFFKVGRFCNFFLASEQFLDDIYSNKVTGLYVDEEPIIV